MMRERHVLVVSTIADVATDDVVRRLTARGIPYYRLNTEDFPFTRTVTWRPGAGSGSHGFEIDGKSLPDPTSVWYRRLRTPSKPEGMDPGIYDFCLQENRAALVGGFLGLSARWMSHPAAVWQSEYKPFQLSLAVEAGLSIPRTIISSDPLAIRKAFADFGRMAAKPTRTGHLIHDGQEYSIFTSQVLEEHLDRLDSARYSPAIYQELVPKKHDLRITVVGRQVFAAAIDSQSDPAAAVDWRRTANPQLPHHAVTLPDQVQSRLLRIMDLAGLTFGAIDMIETPDNDYVFLEINPSGQWLWIDDVLGLGISDALAEWLGEWTAP